MQMSARKMRVVELAALVGGKLRGDGELMIERIAALDDAGEGAIAFVEGERAIERAAESRASCLIVPEGAPCRAPACIEVKQPKLAFARIAAVLHPRERRAPGIAATAIIAPGARIAATAYVGPYARIGAGSIIGERTEIHDGVSVGAGVKIGDDCVIYPNVVIYDGVAIGDRVVLHAGVSVGADGFGYVRDADGYCKFPQIGTVIIEDDVEIGANTCIDRGALGATRIGRGTKIDNLVQIAHNVQIGERVVIAAQTGISGSTVIEDDCVIGGQVGMGDHARVRRGAVIGSKAGILPGKIVRPGGIVWGIPARPLDEYKRLNALWGRLPELRAEVEELKREVRELKARLATSSTEDQREMQ
ncbi:UDP-3-O-(3-hydroxymyristoyl) glucosamine N-acyltransferase [Pyrinomonas methylaliphatogenes]|uniref:UDP-3-O-acylglucosamine N-acyltransferase n=2 Tax=Pyrinomonas methylaliphatogenes TaxID=454194 RepID=A0A0B6WZY5_9BACT|nr:UDP-3-O-(3-hydroxymyristoyl) glucosamine N-acyltransferase [Pyrinomonas methylaliphatogenes]